MLIRLTVVGSINLGFSMQAERMPVSGENVRAEDLELAPAGEGALQAIAAARLGAEVTLVGCVGHDSHGQVLRRRLSHEGVNVKYLATDAEVGTGMAFEVVADHHHRVFSVLDANLRCTPEHIESTHRAFERAGFVLLSLGLPEDTVNRALQVSADCEVQVLLQPAPLSKKPPQLWNRANLLTPSRVAAARLSGKPTEDQAGLVAALEKLRARGLDRVALPLGAGGCLLADAEGLRQIPGFPVPPVDPCGAEEAFAAALALRLAEEAGLEEAATFACATAALTAGGKGALAALPTRAAVEELLKKSRRGGAPRVKRL